MYKRVEEICENIKETDAIDYRYDHFREDEAVPTPFILYRRVAPTAFSADGTTYHHGENVDIELYADTPEEMAIMMEKMEQLLDEHEIYYRLTADTVYIESQDFYESLYEV